MYETFLSLLKNTFHENVNVYYKLVFPKKNSLRYPKTFNRLSCRTDLFKKKEASIPSLMHGVNSILKSKILFLKIYFLMLY